MLEFLPSCLPRTGTSCLLGGEAVEGVLGPKKASALHNEHARWGLLSLRGKEDWKLQTLGGRGMSLCPGHKGTGHVLLGTHTGILTGSSAAIRSTVGVRDPRGWGRRRGPLWEEEGLGYFGQWTGVSWPGVACPPKPFSFWSVVPALAPTKANDLGRDKVENPHDSWEMGGVDGWMGAMDGQGLPRGSQEHGFDVLENNPPMARWNSL